MGTSACSEDTVPVLDVPWEPRPTARVPFVCHGRSAWPAHRLGVAPSSKAPLSPGGADSSDPRPQVQGRGASLVHAPKAALLRPRHGRAPPSCPRVRLGHSVTTQLPSPRCFEGCLKENTPRVTSVCPEPQPGQLCLWELGRVETAPGLPLTGRTPERPALPPPEAGPLGRRSPSRNQSPRDCMRSPGALKETMILIIC